MTHEEKIECIRKMHSLSRIFDASIGPSSFPTAE